MKILFLGDYSGLHACIAAELRRKGHDVTVVSDSGAFMKTPADIQLSRTPGMKGGIAYLFRLFNLLPQMKGYDVVQLVNANFLALKPGKIKYFFDILKRENGAIHLTLAGDDHFFVKACADAKMFRFSEYKVGDQPTQMTREDPERMYGWISDANHRWSEYLYKNIDGAISVLPEYDMAARPILGDRLTFTNLPVDLSTLPYSPLEISGPIKLFIGMKSSMAVQKGTDRLLETAKKIERDMPGKVITECVRDLSLKDYLTHMRDAHIVLDQLYSYSPATNALQAMALGKVAATGAQPEYFDYLGMNAADSPIIGLSPLEDPEPALRSLIENPKKLIEMGRKGRELVERHNSVENIAPLWMKSWQKS